MTAAIAASKVSSSDRFSFTLILAVALHALVILGVGFKLFTDTSAAPSTIEVILTKTQNIDAPEDAEVIAEHNQVQSGSVDFDARPTSPSVTNKSWQGKDQNSSAESSENSTRAAENEIIVHQNKANGETFTRRVTTQENTRISQQELHKNQQNVAQLVSELSREMQIYAKLPRINHVDTLSAKSAIEAKYIKDWVQKVEIIGNINYPSQAKKKMLSGTLILRVLVNFDGKVVSTSVQQSSGEKLLDDAAVKVIRLSAPFREFPSEMREQYDQLMITRTWVYHSSNTLSTN